MANPYCDVLGIATPRLEQVRDHREATTYALLIVALLERGAPMTLPEVAERFAQAGVAPARAALESLKRCRPARPPVWRDGERYGLDPHDDMLDLRVFMLDLRPPRFPPRQPAAPVALPGPEQRLTTAELDEAWRQASLDAWSRQRLVLAVLDVHDGPMAPDDVTAFVAARTARHGLTADPAKFKRPGSAVAIDRDGRWAVAPGAGAANALAAARTAVRDRLAMLRRWSGQRPDADEIAERRRIVEAERTAHAGVLARLRRVIVHGFPAAQPAVVVLLDVGERRLDAVGAEAFDDLRRRLDGYDVIAAIDVRAFLRAIGYDPGLRRLADLAPPQKTIQLGRRGRPLRITTELLIRGSCGISRPLGVPQTMRTYLREGDVGRLRRRLEADAKSLYALYRYGRLHGSLRLRWGFLDERLPAPWVHPDEPTLHVLKEQALELGLPLEVVTGSAPGWAEPWSRAHLCTAHRNDQAWWTCLVDADGFVIDDPDVQLARIATVTH